MGIDLSGAYYPGFDVLRQLSDGAAEDTPLILLRHDLSPLLEEPIEDGWYYDAEPRTAVSEGRATIAHGPAVLVEIVEREELTEPLMAELWAMHFQNRYWLVRKPESDVLPRPVGQVWTFRVEPMERTAVDDG